MPNDTYNSNSLSNNDSNNNFVALETITFEEPAVGSDENVTSCDNSASAYFQHDPLGSNLDGFNNNNDPSILSTLINVSNNVVNSNLASSSNNSTETSIVD